MAGIFDLPAGTFASPTVDTPAGLPIDAPTQMTPPAPFGAWSWSTVLGRYVRIAAPRFFPIHPIAARDQRIIALANGERVAVPGAVFLLWEPVVVPALHLCHRGRVAVSIGGGCPWTAGVPDLWLDGEPFAFLRSAAAWSTLASLYAWVRTWIEGREAVWFTLEGRTLWKLIAFSSEAGPHGYRVVELERAH
jgi:hypothetical protein